MTRLTCGVAASIALMVAGCTGMAQPPSSSTQSSASGMTAGWTKTGTSVTPCLSPSSIS